MPSKEIGELENASAILNAPPHLVSTDERRAAENVFLEFRQSKTPYALCQEILETSKVPFVQFEASEVIKRALIREWASLSESDIVSFRQYLTHYVISRDVAPFVQDRLLQVISIMVKRASVDDFGRDRDLILSEVENLILNADTNSKQILGCKLILSLIQEYAVTVKSSDVGLAWEIHIKVKKQFEATDLKRIFKFCIQVLSEIIRSNALAQPEMVNLTRFLVLIVERILCWGFRAYLSSKRLIGFCESTYELDELPCLRLGLDWKEIMFAPQFLPIMFQLYWKVREIENVGKSALTCLIQLASLTGRIFKEDQDKTNYGLTYMENLLKLLGNSTIRTDEAIGISNLIRKLETFFGKLPKLPQPVWESYLDDLTRLTCLFAERAAAGAADARAAHADALDNLLEAWADAVGRRGGGAGAEDTSALRPRARRVFDAYLRSRLAPDDGFRTALGNDSVEEVEDGEDGDRVKCREQLQNVGVLARFLLEYSLPVLHRLLQSKISALSQHLQSMQSRPMTINEWTTLENLFEDIHWIVLIAGHTVCMESDGEIPLIPSDVNRFSILQFERNMTTIDDTLRCLASVGSEASENCDLTIAILIDVLRLCEIEKAAVEAKLGQFLSPEVGCTLMWFLRRFCSHYVLFDESFYEQISRTIVSAVGRDTEGAIFVLDLVLEKIRTNLINFNSEPVLIKDTVELFTEIVGIKSDVILKSKGLWKLWLEQSNLNSSGLPEGIRRDLIRGFVSAGAFFSDKKSSFEYFDKILSPIQGRFKNLLTQENLVSIYQEERVRIELLDLLECFIGVCKGAKSSTSEILFRCVEPVFREAPKILNLYKNYQIIVQNILEFFGQAAKSMLIYLGPSESKVFHESVFGTIRVYSTINLNKFSIENSDNSGVLEELDSILKLLTYILSKDILGLNYNDEEITVTAVEVVLYSLNFITPLITLELLKYPSLCLQYYKLIVLTNDVAPEKVCATSEEFFEKLLFSIEIGLRKFTSEVVQSCFDFLDYMTIHVHRNKQQISEFIHRTVSKFIKTIFDLLLSQQFNSDVIPTAGRCVYSLICTYNEVYHMVVRSCIERCPNEQTAERLTAAFVKLTENVTLDMETVSKIKFKENFDRFATNISGFLFVK